VNLTVRLWVGALAWVLTASALAQSDGVAQADAVVPGLAAAPEPFQTGWASWYGGKRWHGRKTSSGERFDRNALTAAHPDLPFGSQVRVLNVANGREVVVRINDRGRFGHRFVIDVSEDAAQRLGFRAQGKARVALSLQPALQD